MYLPHTLPPHTHLSTQAKSFYDGLGTLQFCISKPSHSTGATLHWESDRYHLVVEEEEEEMEGEGGRGREMEGGGGRWREREGVNRDKGKRREYVPCYLLYHG